MRKWSGGGGGDMDIGLRFLRRQMTISDTRVVFPPLCIAGIRAHQAPLFGTAAGAFKSGGRARLGTGKAAVICSESDCFPRQTLALLDLCGRQC